MDSGVKRGLGLALIGVPLFLIGLAGRTNDQPNGAVQLLGFVGFVLLAVGLVTAGLALRRPRQTNSSSGE